MNDVVFYPDFSRQKRLDFLKMLTLLSVPMKQPAAIGAFQIEALASGVPVVQPRIGGFTELIESTCGGLLYEPNDSETLGATLEELLLKPESVRELGECGRGIVFNHYNHKQMASEMIEVYQKMIY